MARIWCSNNELNREINEKIRDTKKKYIKMFKVILNNNEIKNLLTPIEMEKLNWLKNRWTNTENIEENDFYIMRDEYHVYINTYMENAININTNFKTLWEDYRKSTQDLRIHIMMASRENNNLDEMISNIPEDQILKINTN